MKDGVYHQPWPNLGISLVNSSAIDIVLSPCIVMDKMELKLVQKDDVKVV